MFVCCNNKSLMATLWQHPNGMHYIRHRNGRTSLRELFPNIEPEKLKQKRVAKQLFNQWKRDRAKGKTALPHEHLIPSKFFEFCKEFLEYAETAYPESTYKLFVQGLNKAKAAWGDIKVSQITPRHIDILLKDMRQSGIAPASINKNYRHVKAALRKAMDWGYMQPIKFPKQESEEKRIRYLSKPELKALMEAIEDEEFNLMCRFAAYSGLRSGELVRLAWSDVDNPEGQLRITAKQKNKKESRIPINRTMRSILEKMEGRNGKKVFRFNRVDWVSQKFKAAARDAGLDNSRFHDLRHTFGSWLAMQGVPIKTIQELMRHESLASTMVYAHLSPDHLQSASETLNLEDE